MQSASESMPSAAEFGAEIMARADAAAAFSEPGDGVTRRFATPEHRKASDLILEWMRDAGMEAWVDGIGNTVGRYEGDRPGLPALMLGSHQDTVQNGGRYDGMLGVIVAIACVKALDARGERLPFAIEVVAFGDEEGLRFGTSLLGSETLAGTFDISELERVDDDAVSLAQAMRDFGLDPAAIPSLARRPEDILAYVETHIEQGPVLEAEGLPLGIVTAIAHSGRLTVGISGTAGHAGTVPMNRRHDALAAACEAVLAIERRCSGIEGLVGTVGKLALAPGAVNVIPGEVTFSVDIRAPEGEVRMAAVRDVCGEIEAIGARRGVRVRFSDDHHSAGCVCTPWVMDQLEAAVVAEGIAPRRLPSGAGHDAMAMVDLTAAGMLFVRCTGGVSHRPDEAITAEDAGVAARALLRFVRDFRVEESR